MQTVCSKRVKNMRSKEETLQITNLINSWGFRSLRSRNLIFSFVFEHNDRNPYACVHSAPTSTWRLLICFPVHVTSFTNATKIETFFELAFEKCDSRFKKKTIKNHKTFKTQSIDDIYLSHMQWIPIHNYIVCVPI